MRVPWTARSNLSILKEISPEYSLEGLLLKLKLQYFGYLMPRTNSLEKTPTEGSKRRGRQRMRQLDGITNLMDMNLSEVWELMMDREAWRAAVHGATKNQTRRNNNKSFLKTFLNDFIYFCLCWAFVAAQAFL